MKSEPLLSRILLTGLLFVSAGCFPSKQATSIPIVELTALQAEITTPTKVVLQDATVVLFPNGFIVSNDTLRGSGEKYPLTGRPLRNQKLDISLADVAAMTKYELRNSSAESFGSFLHLVTGSAVTALSIYCLVCPKCCFGSCPTVYTYDGTKYNLEAELFSHCIARNLEENDTDILTEAVPPDRKFRLRVTNEALETHYVNKLSVFAAYHRLGTKVYSTSDGEPVAVGAVTSVREVTSRIGEVVTSMVRSQDSLAYRSSESVTAGLVSGDPVDWLDVKFSVPDRARTIRMVVRLRNTLLSTVLLYDLVLASQGIRALAWTDRMDADVRYASIFRDVYRTFSGVSVQVLHNGEWVPAASIHDVGPLAWKTVTFLVPVEKGGEQTVRLRFVPDNFMIDMVGVDTAQCDQQPLMVKELVPSEIRDNAGAVRSDVLPLISSDDDRYLVTNPGESFRMVYSVPERLGFETTVFIRSKGYYNEWLRGRWIREAHTDYTFNLFAPQETIAHLGRHWLEGKEEIESRFFESRIPVKEVQ